MLDRNPSEGLPLDRLWQGYAELGRTSDLIREYQLATESASGQIILGYLLQKAGHSEEALAAFLRARSLTTPSPSTAQAPHISPKTPLRAAASLERARHHYREAATLLEEAIATPPSLPSTAPPAQAPLDADLLLELGEAWMAAGELERGAAAWERATILHPQNLDLRSRLAEAYLAHQLGDRALSHLDFLRTHSPPEGRVQALQQMARIHQKAGRGNQAIGSLEAALSATGPHSWMRPELQSQFIRLHQRLQRTEELEEKWSRHAETNPRDIAGYLQLLDLFERLGQQEQQLLWLGKLCNAAPNRPEYLLRLARLQAHMDLLPQAAGSYDRLLSGPQPDPELVLERARLDIQMDAPDRALSRVNTLLSQNPDNENIRQRAIDFFQAHRFDAPLEAALRREAENAPPESPEAKIALANFYFAQRRPQDARQSLAGLIPEKAPPADQIAARMRVAQLLREQGQNAAAREELHAALTLQPDSRDALLALAELEQTRENSAAARSALERALDLSQTPAEALEVDQKLFESILGTPDRKAEDRDRSAGAGTEIADYLLKLTRAAAEKPSAARWLRVARWQLWHRSLRVAQDCAQRALALEPGSPEAHEFLVRIASVDGQLPLALSHLEALQALDPEHRSEYERRAAQVQLDLGHPDDALKSFATLAERQPGNLQALEDLGGAQQRAERWQEALLTWQKAETLASTSRRREIQNILLRLHERLGHTHEAALLLLAQVDAQAGEKGDERTRLSSLHELLTHCSKHGLLDWLKAEFEQRYQRNGEDYFTEATLGRIYKALGDNPRAFERLSAAAFSAPNQADTLPDLVREAEELRRLPMAVKLQGLLIRSSPQWQPAALEKLAQLQERAGQLEEAAKTWTRLAGRFPRDTSVLFHAAEFELRWGPPDRALALFRRIRLIDPSHLPTLSHLAELALDDGLKDEARSCLEDILSHTEPERSGAPLLFPGHRNAPPGRIQNAYLTAIRIRGTAPNNDTLRALRSFWLESPATGSGNAESRLGAIRKLAKLAAESGSQKDLQTWKQRWLAQAPTQPSEALCALFYAGAGSALLDVLDPLTRAPATTGAASQAFLWFALQAGEWQRLQLWIHDPARSSEERDCLSVALSEYFETPRPQMDPETTAQLFPADIRLWQTALALAQHGRLDQAISLTEHLVKPSSPSDPPTHVFHPQFHLDIAHWNLALGRQQAAERLLYQAALSPCDSFDSPALDAIRELLLLAPKPLRASRAKELLDMSSPQTSSSRTSTISASIRATVIHGVLGNVDSARQSLQQLLDMRVLLGAGESEPADATTRHWSFLLSAGNQLQQWGLAPLALFLWEKALADPALIALQQSENNDALRARVFEVRTSSAALRVLSSSPPQLEGILRAHRQQAGIDGLVSLAELLEAKGAFWAAISIHRQLFEADPGNPHALRSLTHACRSAHDIETLEAVLQKSLIKDRSHKNDAGFRELLLQLADVLEDQGKIAESIHLLTSSLAEGPSDHRMELRLAQLLVRESKPAEAEAIYQKILHAEPTNGGARMALTQLLKSQLRFQEALALLEKSVHPDVEIQRVELYALNSQLEDALATLDRLPASNQIGPTEFLVRHLQKQGAPDSARLLLKTVIGRTSDPRSAFSLQTEFLRLLGPETATPILAREWRQLRKFASEKPDLEELFFQIQGEIAHSQGYLAEARSLWLSEWKDGNGRPESGAALLRMELEKQPPQTALLELATFLESLLSHNTLTSSLLEHLSRVTSTHPELWIRVQQRIIQRNPLDPAPVVALSKRFAELGRKPEAIHALETLGLQSVANEEIARIVAPPLAALDADSSARRFFDQATVRDPAAQYFQTHLQYARFLRNHQEFGPAIKILRTAFRNPANQSYGEILTTFLASGKSLRDEMLGHELAPFWLSPSREQAIRKLAAQSPP
jgi:predicted Zn-dependent protease